MNPARTFGPKSCRLRFHELLVYVAGPLAGAMLAVGAAWVLRGPAGAAPGQAPPRATSTRRSSTPTRPKAGTATRRRRGQRMIPGHVDLRSCFLAQ